MVESAFVQFDVSEDEPLEGGMARQGPGEMLKCRSAIWRILNSPVGVKCNGGALGGTGDAYENIHRYS